MEPVLNRTYLIRISTIFYLPYHEMSTYRLLNHFQSPTGIMKLAFSFTLFTLFARCFWMTFSFSVWVHDINTLLLRANPTDFSKKNIYCDYRNRFGPHPHWHRSDVQLFFSRASQVSGLYNRTAHRAHALLVWTPATRNLWASSSRTQPWQRGRGLGWFVISYSSFSTLICSHSHIYFWLPTRKSVVKKI